MSATTRNTTANRNSNSVREPAWRTQQEKVLNAQQPARRQMYHGRRAAKSNVAEKGGINHSSSNSKSRRSVCLINRAAMRPATATPGATSNQRATQLQPNRHMSITVQSQQVCEKCAAAKGGVATARARGHGTQHGTMLKPSRQHKHATIKISENQTRRTAGKCQKRRTTNQNKYNVQTSELVVCANRTTVWLTYGWRQYSQRAPYAL
ncbi:hypothetical protein AVEN_206666-1 [Araneus ventricosus]|uniref:Uncharacterized protein n=1 Tax=Araneus ventricosus TaxID=182803 RepID=A0A4Y2VH09_ARAVE|nr:hypothetical protein AVEN_206666-1 [Araneus ventricosus]